MSRLFLRAIAAALGLLGAVLGAPIGTGPALAAGRVALVIGNSDYQYARKLLNPARDAAAMAATFQKAGFDVVNASNVTNLQFKRAIRQFEHEAADADIAVVYYAGHGIELHGTNYLIPVDAILANDEDADDEAISLDRLVESADGAQRLRVVILDACRDNPFLGTARQHPADAAKPHPAAPATQHPDDAAGRIMRGLGAGGLGAVQPTEANTLIAYAAKAGSTAEDGDGEHSPFATALMDNLFVAGLDIRLAFGRVRDEVLKTTDNRQEPFVYGSLGGGNISLVPAPAQESAAAAEDPEKVKADYSLVEKIGTKGAWQVFLTQHPTGFYSELARQQIAALEAAKPSSSPSAAEQGAWDKIKDSKNADDFRDFMKKYPASVLAPVAEVRADALEQAAKDREREEALQREEQALRAQLAEAKRQAEEAARQRAAQDAALAKVQAEARAAEQARQQAERDARLKAEEAARQKRLADAALAQQQDAAAAAQKKAEQDAALAKAQQEAAAAEQARQQAERDAALKVQEAAKQAALAEAARQQEAACNDEQSRLDTLQAEGRKAKDDLSALAQGLNCQRLRPLVMAALEQAGAPEVNTPDQVRAAQSQLARLGCYADAADGSLNASTRAAIALYERARGKPASGGVQIDDAFVAELKGQTARVCEPEPAPAVAHREGEEKPASKKVKAEEEKRPAREKAASRPQRPKIGQEASFGGGHAGAAIGVGF